MLNDPFNFLFGIIITITSYVICRITTKKFKKVKLNSYIMSIVILSFFLFLTDVSIDQYSASGDYIALFMGPIIVALAVPLYRQYELIKENMGAIIIGIVTGIISSVLSVYFLSMAINLETVTIISLYPRSITTPMGIELSLIIGGNQSTTVLAIILTGIIGAQISPYILKKLKVDDPVASGIAIGTASHVIGTARAMEMGKLQGTMSGLAISLAGIITVIILPIIVSILL